MGGFCIKRSPRIPTLQTSLAPYSTPDDLRIAPADSPGLTRIHAAAKFATIALLLIGSVSGDLRNLLPAAAFALLARSLGKLNPAGRVFVCGPAGIRFTDAVSTSAAGICCSVEVRGRTSSVLWIEYKFRPGEFADRRPPGAFLVFSDALPDPQWRRFRRWLRLQAYSEEIDVG